MGDYLGAKIPSLLEFMENKIQMRQIKGMTHLAAHSNEPKGINHKMNKKLFQEEKLEKLMREKDQYHTNIIFESELENRMIPQPFVVPQQRDKIKKLVKHRPQVNPYIHGQMMERVVYQSKNIKNF